MTAVVLSRKVDRRLLRFVSPSGSAPPSIDEQQDSGVPAATDMERKLQAMAQIRAQPFVMDANEPQFAAAQRWIEQCADDVSLPLNFCGGLLIIRLYRLITQPEEQSETWMEAVIAAAAAYDFAFLALAHADDEADLTVSRNEKATRHVTNPETRAVDGLNLILAGITAMQQVLARWPQSRVCESRETNGFHPLANDVMTALLRALREASFPILLDRAGLGHAAGASPTFSGLAPILIDEQSLGRVQAFARHRAHTYFMRATDLATLLAGYQEVDPKLASALDELFGLWGILGAGMDDLQDIFIDFAAGIHSICTVMAHLCVAKEPELRPSFRQNLAMDIVSDQQARLAECFGATDKNLDKNVLLALLEEIELRKALTEHFEQIGTDFAAAIYKAASKFGFSARLMTEIVSIVCGDPNFAVPEIYHLALATVTNETVLGLMNVQVGKFITVYFVDRYWPLDRGDS